MTTNRCARAEACGRHFALVDGPTRTRPGPSMVGLRSAARAASWLIQRPRKRRSSASTRLSPGGSDNIILIGTGSSAPPVAQAPG
jgi:hypothetical protein